MAYYISPDKCPHTHICPIIPLCPMNAITQNGMDLPVIDESVCIECGVCEMVCSSSAVLKK